MDWWNDLQQTHATHTNTSLVVKGEHLLSFLIQSGKTFELRGVGGVGDPLLDQALLDAIEIASEATFPALDTISDDHTPLGAIDLDGVVMVAMEDPTCGVHGVSVYWVLLPGAALLTQLPNIPVSVGRSDASNWDDPSLNEANSPAMIDLISNHTKEVLVSMGTQYGDPFYPCGAFHHYPEAIAIAAVESGHDALSVSTAQTASTRSGPRL